MTAQHQWLAGWESNILAGPLDPGSRGLWYGGIRSKFLNANKLRAGSDCLVFMTEEADGDDVYLAYLSSWGFHEQTETLIRGGRQNSKEEDGYGSC